MAEPDIGRAFADSVRSRRGVSGSVHRVEDGSLHLVTHFGLPSEVALAVVEVAKGKGMAGLAWARLSPVQTCNLQADTTGDVQPLAQQVSARCAVALPVVTGGRVCIGVVGIAFAEESTLTSDELQDLIDWASWTYHLIDGLA